VTRRRRIGSLLVAGMVTVASACGGSAADENASTSTRPRDETTASPPTTGSTSTTAAATEAPATTGAPSTPSAPEVEFAAALVDIERAIADPSTPPDALADTARRQQLAYRAWSGHPEWDSAVFAGLPPDIADTARLHLDARRAFLGMATRLSDTVPAWEIVEPAPAAELLAYYREAEAQSGVEWEYLAAINLVETGMGRIRGLSTAGAQGPMQFLPSTFETWGQGGDINDPRDSILAAGRFLADKGAPADMDAALYRYNNHDNYVAAVTAYATIIRQTPRAYDALHAWEIQYLSAAGDLWLAVGYRSDIPVPAADYAASNPDAVVGPVPPQVATLPPR
jgi:membrane-bound lytic murein transglycosylase B